MHSTETRTTTTRPVTTPTTPDLVPIPRTRPLARAASRRLAVGCLALALLAGTAACKGGSSTTAAATGPTTPAITASRTTPPSTSTGTTRTTPPPTSVPTSGSPTTSGTSSPSTGHATGGVKNCSAKDVSATINGAAKCLQAGQQCQSKAVAQYPAYGFDCVQTGNRWILHKRP